jgi:hypothetical protein
LPKLVVNTFIQGLDALDADVVLGAAKSQGQ